MKGNGESESANRVKRRRKPHEHPNRLSLRLHGPRITADRFKKAVNAFFSILDGVTDAVTGRKRSVVWLVSVEKGSSVIVADPTPRVTGVSKDVAMIPRAVISGMASLGQRSRRPKQFNDDVLRSAKDLGAVIDGTNVRLGEIVWTGKAVSVEPEIGSHVDSILGLNRIRDYGSVEGRLQMISVRGTTHFAVYDALTDHPVRCEIGLDQLDGAYENFNRRVIVSGIMRYGKADGFVPKTIQVGSIEAIPGEADLPGEDDVYGILSRAR